MALYSPQIEVPTDYIPGYEKARALDPERADNYISHTTIGDPIADALMELLSELPQEEASNLLRLVMSTEAGDDLDDTPSLLREFQESTRTPPAWLDLEALEPGIRMFHRNANLVLGGMIGGVLVEGFSTNIAKSFFITGRLRDQGVRRLKQNNRHMVEIFMPGGLAMDGDGWKLSVRIRLAHAQVRRLLNTSDDWDYNAWGIPISSAHVGFAIAAFSARLLKHIKSLGATYNDEERKSFMDVWRYTGHLMGIPETILFRDEAEALEIFKIGLTCEPSPGVESIVMANALINSAPLVAGIAEPKERRNLTKYVFGLSRALIGSPLADELMYPPSLTLGVLAWFRMQVLYQRTMGRFFPGITRTKNFDNFTSLLNVSLYDEAGIDYRLPDHVYSEQSKQW